MEFLKLIDANIIKLIITLIICFIVMIGFGTLIARNQIKEQGEYINIVLNFIIKVLNLVVLTVELIYVGRILFWIFC